MMQHTDETVDDIKRRALERITAKVWPGGPGPERAGPWNAETVAEHAWYALAVHATREELAAEQLSEWGVTTFVPMETLRVKVVESRHARGRRRCRFEDVTRPLMRGYVFGGFRGVPAWGEVRRVKFVRGVVGIDGRPVSVPNCDIERFMRAMGDGTFTETRPEIGPGDRVKLTEGPFKGFPAEVVDVVEKAWGAEAMLLLWLFGQETAVRAPLDELEIYQLPCR